MPTSALVLTALLSAAVCAAAIVLLDPLARKIGLIDHPGGRKKHDCPVPLTGGPAIFLGLLAATLVVPDSYPGLTGLLIAAGLLVFVGLLDDLLELRAIYKLVAQTAAAAIMIWLGDNRISGLSNLFYEGPLLFGPFGDIFTIIATLAMINAVNMSDGIDGLAGSLCAVTLTALAFAAWHAELPAHLGILLATLAGIGSFLFFNAAHPLRPKRRSFLGDSGSMVCGLIVAWFLVELAKTTTGAINSVTVLWIAAVPVMDLSIVMARRIYKRRSPLGADREHLHHLLEAANLSSNQIVFLITGYAALLAVLGITAFLLEVSQPVMFYGIMALFLLHAWTVQRAWRTKKWLGRVFKTE